MKIEKMDALPLPLLSTFVAFVEAPNITEAARRLAISQPAVSVHLKKLEEALPQPLFIFRGKKKVLTQYGSALFEAAKKNLNHLQKKIHTINLKFLDSNQIKLKFGVRREIHDAHFDRVNLISQLQFYYLSNNEILSRLKSHDLDLGVSHEKPDDPNLVARFAFSEKAQIVVSKKFLKKGQSLNQAMNDPVFLTQTPCFIYKEKEPPFISQWCKHVGVLEEELNTKAICEDWGMLYRWVCSGQGYSIVPTSLVVQKEKIESVIISEKVIPEVRFYLIYSKEIKGLNLIQNLLNWQGSELRP